MKIDMTDLEIVRLLENLASKFNFHASVRFTNGEGARGGQHLKCVYKNGIPVDHFGVIYGRKGNGWFPNGESTIIHEFAHCLDRARKTYERRRPHGPMFFKALLDTITVSGCYSLTDHPWEYEYNAVYMEACRRGLTTKVWHQHVIRAAAKAHRTDPTFEVAPSRPPKDRRFTGKCQACGKESFRTSRFSTRQHACLCQSGLDWSKKKLILWTDTKTGETAHIWVGLKNNRRPVLIHG